MRGDGNQLEVHVFAVTKYSGTLVESDEMKPQWCVVVRVRERELNAKRFRRTHCNAVRLQSSRVATLQVASPTLFFRDPLRAQHTY